MKEYQLFDGRYNVVIGDRGGVTVYSKATRKPLKVYGRKTNGIRFVNLTPVKGAVAESYNIEAIKVHVLHHDPLFALTQEEISYHLKRDEQPPLLNDPEVIESLPEEKEGVFTEYNGTWIREYKKACFYKTSNGYLKYCYYVSIHNTTDGITTTNKTDIFTDKSQIVIRDLSSLPDDVLKEVEKEKKKRKRWVEYCEALRIDPDCPDIKASEYYQQGFETWQKMKREFSYYRYMADNA